MFRNDIQVGLLLLHWKVDASLAWANSSNGPLKAPSPPSFCDKTTCLSIVLKRHLVVFTLQYHLAHTFLYLLPPYFGACTYFSSSLTSFPSFLILCFLLETVEPFMMESSIVCYKQKLSRSRAFNVGFVAM